MKKLFFVCCFLGSGLIFGQEFKRLNFAELQQRLTVDTDSTYVVNFWATWCAPCVKELPYFEALASKYPKQNLKVILVSLDFIEQIETAFRPFLKENTLKSEIILLDAPNENEWIPKVNDQWSGSIPATLIYRRENKRFYEQSFTEESLDKVISEFLDAIH